MHPNFNFNQVININFRGYTRPIPLTNSFGNVYPVLLDDILANVLNVTDSDKVLDIGGGSNPFSKATVVTEPYLEYSAHRSGRQVKPGIEYLECFAEDLPFDNKSFDFAISRQVFEHTNSPSDACKEMMRVSKRGFIETPQKKFELLFGPNPSHNWFVSVEGDTIVFERRKFIRHSLRHLGMSAFPSSQEGQLLLHWEFKNLTNVQFYWEDHFKYEVIDSQDGFNYANPIHASEAHLDVAICGILQGGFYLDARASDARTAIQLRPDWSLAHNTLGVILWKQGDLNEALSEFRIAAELEKRDEYKHNASLSNPADEPILVDFEYALPIDEEYCSKYLNSYSLDTSKLLK
ncbi:class I SAM-dependent methyltransferase [Paenibacillus sp. GbtcB18]|uniref:class I SAM-dependent methyltransferase n=1 Tax=Paenibacillus sp. GbtcB18 TaxID=2824763 RepID=UPI001C3072D0|nr:methyltransferase domain-containing protein [Paenibacillus sp. GbtcB18]